MIGSPELILTYRVEVLVERVEPGGAAAVGVVPPVADEDLLVEDGALGAQEAVLPAVVVAIVVHLRLGLDSWNLWNFSLLLCRVVVASTALFSISKQSRIISQLPPHWLDTDPSFIFRNGIPCLTQECAAFKDATCACHMKE